MTNRQAEIEEAIYFIENHADGIPVTSTANIIIDIESISGLDLTPDERVDVAKWYRGLGIAQD